MRKEIIHEGEKQTISEEIKSRKISAKEVLKKAYAQ